MDTSTKTNVTSPKTSDKETIGKANGWRRNVLQLLANLMLIWDRNEARRALKCPDLSSWSFKGLALADWAKAKKAELISQMQTIVYSPLEFGFTLRDLEYFVSDLKKAIKDNHEADAIMVAEFKAGKSPLSEENLQKCKIDACYDRQRFTMLIDILNVEIARRNEVARKAREEADTKRLAREEANRQRIAELKAKEAETEAKRQEYLRKKMEEARARRNTKYVPPVKRVDFSVKVSSFEALAEIKAKAEADVVIANRKAGVFAVVEIVPKAKALEIAGLDAKTFDAAYKAVKTESDADILTLSDFRKIGFIRNGAAVRYVVKA
jgi:hypothetical protein